MNDQIDSFSMSAQKSNFHMQTEVGASAKKEISRSLTPKILNSSQKVNKMNTIIDPSENSNQILETSGSMRIQNNGNIEMIGSGIPSAPMTSQTKYKYETSYAKTFMQGTKS